MKKPMSKAKPATKERAQGHVKGSGVNKKMPTTSVPQVVARTTVTKPDQRRPMG